MRVITQLVLPDQLALPPRLFDYTSQSGLLGILSTRTLWATRIQYLNDSTEFGYTLGFLKNAVYGRQLYGPSGESKTANALTTIYKALESLSRIHIHVACFSESPDDLSQWRGYGPGGNGYSIGFELSELVDAADRQDAFLAPCIYDLSRQSELIKQLLEASINDIISEQDKNGESNQAVKEFKLDCVFLASVLKHPTFKAEHEWRIVSRPISDENPKLALREGKAVLIPHLRFELAKAEEKPNIQIVVGPNPEMDLAMESVGTLLISNKYTSGRSCVT